LKTHYAQVMPKALAALAGQALAAWHSAGDLAPVLSITFRSLPRLAGVTSPRQRWLGPGRAGKEAMISDRVGSNGVTLVMINV